MNPLLAYIDTRPLIFVAGWLLILLLWLGARKIRGYRGPMLLLRRGHSPGLWGLVHPFGNRLGALRQSEGSAHHAHAMADR